MLRRTGIISSAALLLAMIPGNAQQTSQRLNRPTPGPTQPKGSTASEALQPTVAPGPPQRIEISIEDARPLAAAASQLQQKFEIPISYEDIQWVHPSDLMPVGQLSHSNAHRLKNPDMPVPALASLRVRFDIDSNTKKPVSSLGTVLQAVLEEHVQRQNPGEFKLVKLAEEGGFSILPSRAKDLQGRMVAAQSPFDVRISLADQERSGDETLAAILNAVTAVSGARFSVFFSVPMERIRLGASDEVARDVLNRLLRESYDWKAYWHLYHDPSEGDWGVNIQALYVETGILTPEGKPEIRPVPWPGRPWVRPPSEK